MTLLTPLELECFANVLLLNYSNTLSVGHTNINIGLSTQFLIDTAARCSLINCDTFAEIEKIQPLVVMPLEKSLLPANEHAMPMKGKVVIMSAFDVEYTCAIEHMVFVSDSPEAGMYTLGMSFLAKFGELINLGYPMLILTVFPGKFVKLSPYLDKLFSIFFTSDLCRVATRFDKCTLLTASFDT